MTAADAVAVSPDDRYLPRSAWFEELVDCGPAKIKLSAISYDGTAPANETLEAARRLIDGHGSEVEATPHRGAGFAILHKDEEAYWFLLHWWVGGGTATRKLWRAEFDDSTNFTAVDPLMMACVWELGITEFERWAWIETFMSGRPVSDYLAHGFPRGFV
jgi:hypothetical protein